MIGSLGGNIKPLAMLYTFRGLGLVNGREAAVRGAVQSYSLIVR